MQITVQVKLKLTQEQKDLLKATTAEYIRLVNQVVADYVSTDANLKYSSKTVVAALPSAVKNQAIQDAKSVLAKYKKAVRSNTRLKPENQKEVKVPLLKSQCPFGTIKTMPSRKASSHSQYCLTANQRESKFSAF